MSYNMRIKLIGRGLVGWHTSNVGKLSSDGQAYASTGSSSGGSLETYLKEAEDETLIYDADQADVGAFAHFVIAGPMVKASLAAGETARFGADKALENMLPGLEGSFATVGAMALAGFSSLDYVAPDVYIALLKAKVPGIKTGKVINHRIVWDMSAQPSLEV